MKPIYTIKTPRARLKLIAVSEENYFSVRARGKMGNSFNDVVTDLLRLGGKKETV